MSNQLSPLLNAHEDDKDQTDWDIQAKEHHKIEKYEDARRLGVKYRQRKILIVDDDFIGRSILEKLVQNIDDDISVIGFESPVDALHWLRLNKVDLVITDYRMPKMNGIELIKNVRKIQTCRNVPIMMITVVSEKSVRYEALDAGAVAFLTRPLDQIECKTSCKNLLKIQEQQAIIEDRAEWLARQVEASTHQIVARERETLLRLGRAGEYRDEETGNHVIRMAKYSRLIAEKLGMDEHMCECIEYAAPMHDIGKIGVPDEILLKRGKLDEHEWVLMQQHAVIGHDILSNSHSRYIQMGSVIALNHHEKFDGSGYPSGLAGTEIPLVARIVTVADVFDALVSERPYKTPWSFEDAIQYLNDQSGKHFDPECVKAFLDSLDEVQVIRAELVDE